MFGTRRSGDYNARRFWSWFATEAHGLHNGLEALARGETDADLLLADLNQRVRRYDMDMQADIVRGLDGACELQLSGGTEASLAGLIAAAPQVFGWRFRAHANDTAARRVPFRLAPRPSLDLGFAIQARHDAYAF